MSRALPGVLPRLTLLALLVACGSSGSKPARPKSVREPALAPPRAVRLEVRGIRLGGSVRLDIVGATKMPKPEPAFEDPRNWRITAVAQGQSFQRVVNGSARVMREPHNGADWDIEVSFSAAFAVSEDVTALTVQIVAPGSAPHTTEVAVEAPAPAPESDAADKDNDKGGDRNGDADATKVSDTEARDEKASSSKKRKRKRRGK